MKLSAYPPLRKVLVGSDVDVDVGGKVVVDVGVIVEDETKARVADEVGCCVLVAVMEEVFPIVGDPKVVNLVGVEFIRRLGDGVAVGLYGVGVLAEVYE